MEHKDRKDDRQTSPHCNSTSSNRSPPGSRLRSQTEQIKKGEKRFLCNTLSTARIASGGVQRLTSAAASEKPHVPSSMADILYALFTLSILTCLISPRQIYNSLYLLPKNKKTLRVDITYHAALPPASLLSFFFLSFYLNSWYARGENRRISLQRAARYYKRAGGRPRYATLTLCYAMLCMLKVVAIMRMQG